MQCSYPIHTITEEQREAILNGMSKYGKETFTELFVTGELYTRNVDSGSDCNTSYEVIRHLSTSTLIHVLYLDQHEVIPSYKQGDWVKTSWDSTLQLGKELENNNGKRFEIKRLKGKGKGGTIHRHPAFLPILPPKESSSWNTYYTRSRQTTIHESSIAGYVNEYSKEMKEIKREIWWEQYGRDCWELEEGDILKDNKGNLLEVYEFKQAPRRLSKPPIQYVILKGNYNNSIRRKHKIPYYVQIPEHIKKHTESNQDRTEWFEENFTVVVLKEERYNHDYKYKHKYSFLFGNK